MKKRAIQNFCASTAYQLTSLLVGLVLPKYYTELYGSVYNGLNQSVSQIMSLLAVLQFGISASSIQQMFQYIATDDKEAITEIYHDTGRQYRQMGLIFISIVFPIALIYPYLLQDELAYKMVVAFLLIRGASSAMEYFFQAKYSVIMIAHNQSYLVYIINTGLLLFSTSLNLLIILTKQNILLYQGVALISTLMRLFIVNKYIRHNYPYLFKRIPITSKHIEKNQRKDVLISEIAGLVIDSTDLLVLSTFSGLISASIYSVYNFVTTGLGNVLGSCREAVFAGIGKSYYTDYEQFRVRMGRFESIYLIIAFYLYSTAIILFKPFIEVYTVNMDVNYVFTGFPILFIAMRLIINIRIPSIIAINTAGHFKQVKYFAVIEAIINLSVSLILVKTLGIYGVLIGTLIGALFRTPILIWYSSKYIMKRPVLSYWKKVCSWLPLFFASYAFSISCPFSFSSLWNWTLAALLTAGVMMAIFIMWLLLFDRKTLHEFSNILNKLRKKKNNVKNI